MTRDQKIEQPCPFLRLSREQPSLASKKRQWLIKIYRQFLDFPSRLAKVEEVGLYQKNPPELKVLWVTKLVISWPR